MTLIVAADLIIPEQKARQWRDSELSATDIAATVSDYPNAEAVIAYRAALRAWPSTSDFPETRPALTRLK